MSCELKLTFPFCYRNGKEKKMEFVSEWKTPTSSVKRRRTTQVISITMAKVSEISFNSLKTNIDIYKFSLQLYVMSQVFLILIIHTLLIRVK